MSKPELPLRPSLAAATAAAVTWACLCCSSSSARLESCSAA